MNEKLQILTTLKNELDSHRPLPEALVKNLADWFRIQLTFTSNAIEGNTLTLQETALVVEKGLTIGGKSLREHLEAVNHVQALDFLRSLLTRKRVDLSNKEILQIHELVLAKIDDKNAGKLRTVAVRIAGSNVVLPNPRKVPELMDEFEQWLRGPSKDHPAKIGADAHLKLVSIHPFTDGNGRTARLVHNLLLMQEGYPPVFIQPEERLAYIQSIEKAQLENKLDEYYQLMFDAMERSLRIYLDAVKQSV